MAERPKTDLSPGRFKTDFLPGDIVRCRLFNENGVRQPGALYRTYNLANAASDLKDRLFFVKAFTFGVIIAVMSRDDALVARDSIFVLDSVTMRTGWIYAAELEKA